MEKNKIAKLLMGLKCVQISMKTPFNYASGLKGPIYCDNRKVISHVNARQQVIDAFLEKIKKSGIKFDSVAGLATAGIPHAAWIADKLSLPMIYVRGKAKEHGKKNLIEGDYSPGDKVILIEDLVNQGSSLENAVLGLQEAGLETAACFCIVSYQMKNVEKLLQKLNLSLFSLTDFSSILDVSKEFLKLSEEDISDLLEWQKSPETWSLKRG
jgi:orotate phosphoribosyltransferase